MKLEKNISIPAAILENLYWDARRNIYVYLMPSGRPVVVEFRPEGFFVLLAV
jgi:hypothetical protein